MPRKKIVSKRKILRDPKYNDLLVAKFINGIMKDGKKSLAEIIFYKAMDLVNKKTKKEPLDIFKSAIENVKPMVEVKSRRVGGATYQVPVDVRGERGISLSIRWILNASRERSGKTLQEKLSAELIDAANKTGNAVKKREDTHKMAEANKAFAHYRW
jgi:small subunit ribosomal protein S7